MMTLYEITTKYGTGKGDSMMWETVAIVSEAIEASMPEADRHALERKIYGKLSGGHYNEQYAMEDVARMIHRDSKGVAHKAPFWTVETVKKIYESVKGELRGYNCWDFYVTLNMVATDHFELVEKWFPGISEKDRDEKFVELALNWLNDEDNPYGGSKAWCYLNG